MSSAALLTVLDSCAPRLDFDNVSVWRIDDVRPNLQRLRVSVLDAVCRERRPYVHYEEAPAPILGASEVRPGLWQLPQDVDGKLLLDWLYMGNWQLYVRSAPLAELSDLCRMRDEDIAEFVRTGGVEVIIDSFHDDVSWVIGANRNDA